MGLRNSLLLYERCFLVVEGETEFATLPYLFRLKYGQPLQNAGIVLVNGKGNSTARKLTEVLVANGKQVVFLVDQDSRMNGAAKQFTAESFARDGIDETRQVFYVGMCEFEDSFQNAALVSHGRERVPQG